MILHYDEIFYEIETEMLHNDITQKEIAEHVCLSESTISNYFKERRRPITEDLIAICEYCGINNWEKLLKSAYY